MNSINSANKFYFPFSVTVNKFSKFSGSCNDTDNPYSKLCISDVVKNMNMKVLNQMSRTTETCCISWHETYACECRLDAKVCKDKQHWNSNKCRWECKKLIDNGRCNDGFIWNPSIYECECDYPINI